MPVPVPSFSQSYMHTAASAPALPQAPDLSNIPLVLPLWNEASDAEWDSLVALNRHVAMADQACVRPTLEKASRSNGRRSLSSGLSEGTSIVAPIVVPTATTRNGTGTGAKPKYNKDSICAVLAQPKVDARGWTPSTLLSAIISS